ncbi:hypothetical protein COO60DRAFT_1703227 [Scenedesmus sp. NREL 46B-D3]|nr:hypothetical protein COO60DRAFT_1703227 [Scenedesmus sp. NREL 46B-D3]
MSAQPCDSLSTPGPPRRFRSSSEELEPSRPAHCRQPQTAMPSLTGIPRYLKPPSRGSSMTGSRTGFSRVTVAPSGSSAAGAASTTGASSRPLQRQLSIMDLVNQAAKKEETEAALAVARRAARSQLMLSAVAAGEAGGASSPAGATAAAAAAATGGKPPMSPQLQSKTNGKGSSGSSQPCASQSRRQAAAVCLVSPKVDDSPAATEMANGQQLRLTVLQQAHGSNSSPLLASKPQPVALLPSQACGSSECGSEDGAGTPPSSCGSLSSSCSSSSLCSAASGLSNASTLSGGSRPKSILLNRTSSSSSSSAGSSPRFSKRVTWKDGSADGGQDLVAVLLLEDTPEMRRVRKDTWPERPGSRRDAADAAVAAAAAASATAAALAEAPFMAQQPGLEKDGRSPQLVSKLLQQPARLLDWRDKLRLLQQERRQQRVAQVQAGWEQQTKQPRHHRLGHQQQQVEQQQVEQQQVQHKQQASVVTADCVKPACAAAGPMCLEAVAAARLPLPAAC